MMRVESALQHRTRCLISIFSWALLELVGCQSVSVDKPHPYSADRSGWDGQREEPPRFRQPDNAHRQQANRDKQSDWMARPKSSTVISERNYFCRRRQVARIGLKRNVIDGHAMTLYET
jgi:hypothetical protein